MPVARRDLEHLGRLALRVRRALELIAIWIGIPLLFGILFVLADLFLTGLHH
jgi:hypothetical protein